MSALPESCFEPSFAARFEVQPMHIRDIDEVLGIEYRVFSFPWGRGHFADSLASGYSCWVCRLGSELIGYFVMMLAVDDAHLLTIGIAPKHQGQGYGGRLLRHAMRVALAGGAQVFLLEVRPSNENAIALYQHFGFKKIGLRKAYYPADGGREDALVMTYPLSELV